MCNISIKLEKWKCLSEDILGGRLSEYPNIEKKAIANAINTFNELKKTNNLGEDFYAQYNKLKLYEKN